MTVRLIDLPYRELHPTVKALSDAGFDNELAELVRKQGGGERAVAALQREFFSSVSPAAPAPVPTTYPVTVDYSQTLEQMIAAGRYDTQNNDITEKNFPLQGTGHVEVELHLVHLNKVASTKDALAKMDRRGLRPATLPELLALGAKYPNLQKEFPLVALGSVWQDLYGGRNAACLVFWGSGRDLDLHWVGGGWYRRCRFVAVSK